MNQNKINLHCHTTYSDGLEPLAVMLMEHKKQGFSTFVVTDHVYPYRRFQQKAFDDYNHWRKQRSELLKLGKYFDFPVIQGIELKLGQEEILLFGHPVIKLVFERIEQDHLDTYNGKDLYTDLIQIIKDHKNQCACVWCHPRFGTGTDEIRPILDGYEAFNCGTDWGALVMKAYNKDLHNHCKGLKPFINSDAHWLPHIEKGQNLHKRPIKSEEDLIAFIKGKRQ